MGEPEQAFESLKKAAARSTWLILSVTCDPRLDGIRSDPRFEQVLQRLGVGVHNAALRSMRNVVPLPGSLATAILPL